MVMMMVDVVMFRWVPLSEPNLLLYVYKHFCSLVADGAHMATRLSPLEALRCSNSKDEVRRELR
jgi:hypothetical protein